MSDLQSQMETATQRGFEQAGLLAFPVPPHQLLPPGVPEHPGLEAVLNPGLDLPLTAPSKVPQPQCRLQLHMQMVCWAEHLNATIPQHN